VQIDLGVMSRAIGDHPAYVVADSVSGLGASEFNLDEWRLDIVKGACVPTGTRHGRGEGTRLGEDQRLDPTGMS
jgi:hypothetical protein